MAKQIKELIYIENVEGRKAQYHKCGILLIKEDGKMSVNIKMIPVGAGFTGWLQVMEPREKSAPAPAAKGDPGPQADDVEPF